MSATDPNHDPIPHGELAALVCIPPGEVEATVVEQIASLGFRCHTVAIPEEMALRLQERVYEVIIVHEQFGLSDLENNPALHLLREHPLPQRRTSFVLLLGPGMESHSVMQAFLYGVDLVLNERDLADFRSIAGRGIVSQEQRYNAFGAVLKREQER